MTATQKLLAGAEMSREDLAQLIRERSPETAAALAEEAVRLRRAHYGTDVYVRGLIEFSNFCKNDCLYCGIRRSQRGVERYRLSEEEILSCCETGFELGYRTFVLQSGEDPAFTPERVEQLVRRIKARFPDCALTLSLGEHPREAYERWFAAGADRYLLRHETASKSHYEKLHPADMSFENRMRCLRDLKSIGYQVGAGMIVGSPFQTEEELAEDLLFLREFQPHMVGVGPFIPAAGTPFEKEPAGTLELTLFLLSVIRILLPRVLLPSTTALGTIHPRGREMGMQAGANVVMPNLSPTEVRDKYKLYDNKICTGDDARLCSSCLSARMASVGYRTVVARGDFAL